jgi:glycosyltransferase involved in cell wall biosynthesis
LEPSLSVLMPVYNGAAYFPEAARSILTQSHADFELIVVDDGSTDASSQVAARLAERDTRVRVLRTERLGVAGALNAGLELCRAPIVARMDADDVALPRRFEIQLAYLASHPDCAALGGQADLIDEDGDPLGWMLNPLDHEAILAALLRGAGAIVHPTAAFPAAAVRAVGGYRTGLLAEDVDLFLRLADRGRLANVPNHLARYRKREGSVTAGWSPAEVNAERRRRAEAGGPAPGLRPLEWVPDPRGEALQIARLGLAIHAGCDATARKYLRRLLRAPSRHPLRWWRIASRIARSYAWRILRPPAVPAP